MGEITDYLAGLDSERAESLQRVVDIALQVAPSAEEGRSYGMPALKVAGRPLIGVLAAKNHLSLFPFSAAALEAVADQLGDFSLSKGTVRFTSDHPLPASVIEQVVALRLAELGL